MPCESSSVVRRLRCWREPHGVDHRVVGRAFGAAVPRAVVVVAVAVALLVGLVVLRVVADEVAQGEAVVGGHEVDAGEGRAALVRVEVAGARQPRGELGQHAALGPPVVADAVAVLAVPLAPAGREVADLVAALTHVPRLGDQLDLVQDGVLLDEVEERREPVGPVVLPGEGDGEVEPEAVDVHLGHPVAEAVHHQLQRVGMVHVEAVAGTGEVEVEPRVVGLPAVEAVVEALEAQRRPEVVPLAGVVVDDVEDHLDARRRGTPSPSPGTPAPGWWSCARPRTAWWGAKKPIVL